MSSLSRQIHDVMRVVNFMVTLQKSVVQTTTSNCQVTHTA